MHVALAELSAGDFIIAGISIAGSLAVSLIVFFLTRETSAQDLQQKQLSELTKTVGRLEAARDKAFEADVRHEKEIEKLEVELRTVREKLLVAEFKLDEADGD